MSDETNVNYTEISDHNELMEYIRKLLEKIRLLTGMYENNLALLTEHNEADSSHADIRALMLADKDTADKLVSELKANIDETIDNINKVLVEHDNRMWDITEVDNVQNDRLNAVELDLPLKIYDKDVSAIGHTGDFNDVLYRPNITISDADKTNTGEAVKLVKNKTELYLPSTIKARFVGDLTGNVNGSADKVDGSHAWQMQTLAAAGDTHGPNSWVMQCQHNVDGDNYFKLYCGDKSIGTKVDRAGSAGYAEISGYSRLLATYADDGHYLCPDRYDGWNTRLYMTDGDKGVKVDNVHVHHADYASRSTNNGGFYISNQLVTIE